MNKKYAAVFVTCGSRKEAEAIADALLKARLIACASIIGGVESRFWWKAGIDKASEVLIIMKTRASNFARVEREVRRLHSYEVPEIVMLPLAAGSKPYLDWIEENVK
jgi:periplasmic divalent cation tolerance protein